MDAPLDATVRLRLDRRTFDALLAAARLNERSVSAETRLALKRHLAFRLDGDDGDLPTALSPHHPRPDGAGRCTECGLEHR